MAAHAPAPITPYTRARMAGGTRSNWTAPISGLSAPAASPAIATTAATTGSGGAAASAHSGGAPHSTYAVTNVARRGSRCPIALNTSEPTSAPPPMTPTSRPNAAGPPSSRSATTGSSTLLLAASNRFVTSTSRTMARSSGSRTRKRSPAANCRQ